MKVQFAGATDVGMKRTHNEDSYYLFADQNLYMVADGMGGHSAGEVASRLAVETVAHFFKESADDDDVTWPYRMEKGITYEENRIAAGIKLANLRIFESAAANPKQRGMGTTLVAALLVRGGVILGHVGDSRVYRWRKGELRQLTEDHSLLNDYIKMKELTPEEIARFPHKNVIVRALGMKDTVQVDVMTDVPETSDVYLLCSDGLSGMVEDGELRDIIDRNQPDLEKTCAELIQAANRHGGVDNVTAVLIRIVPN
jgi:serine/threonine protein phosphatase PrpC